MKSSRNFRLSYSLAAVGLGVCVTTALLLKILPTPVMAQSAVVEAPKTNAASPAATTEPSAATNAAAPLPPDGAVRPVLPGESADLTAPPAGGRAAGPGGRGLPPRPEASAGITNTNEIQLSFQNANIDMIIQW